ncbi:hydrolase [Thiohalorhabdus sp.]|uniref:hydrolase n=1 Tax=Thiohalorhabdus sp. TaxID=3094134 RepID=UPI002FC2CE52
MAFRPAWWLPGGHLQTLWPALLRRPPSVAMRRERLELADGDFLDLDWAVAAPAQGPVVLLLHGLEGGRESHYPGGLMQALAGRGMRPVLMYQRGCSGEPNRSHRRYTGGDTGDLAAVIAHLRRTHPEAQLAVVGYSLGGNILLKWLGETGADNPLTAAVAVSPPFRLDRAADRLEHGLSRLYQRHLLGALRRAIRGKYRDRPEACPVPLAELDGLDSFRDFDDRFTGPVHGYAGADDYYARCSSRPFLGTIDVPTAVIHALDDPFTTPDAVPDPGEVSRRVRLDLHVHGGHVGFVGGAVPGRARYWLEQAIPRFLEAELAGV